MVDVVDDTLKWCSVAVKEVIDRGYRLEASVYDVDAKSARESIYNGKYPVVSLCGDKGLCDAYTRGRFRRIWLKRSKYPIYQPSTIGDVYPKPDGYLSKETNVDMDSLRVHKGQILLTCSGTIGNVGLVADALDNQIFSHDLLRITCKNADDIGYVYSYLKSRIGNRILCTNSYGSVITHIEASHLESVPIPNAPKDIKKRINDLINKSYALRDQSNKLIDEAEEILVQELCLPSEELLDINDKRDAFSIQLSRMNYRLDGSYHLPVVDYLNECLRKKAEKVVRLGDNTITKEIILAPRFKRVYVEEGHGRVFIGGKEIYQLDPNNKKYLSSVNHKELIKDKLEIHENMTLITCSGTIGKVAFVGKHWEGWTVNQHVLRIVPANEDLAGYLYIFLQSKYGYYLITKYTYGSVIDEIDDNQIGEIPIPILKDEKKQKEINDLAIEANQKRYQAYVCEKEALSIMEKEVLGCK